MRRTIILALLIILYSRTAAQDLMTVTGTVYDKTTGQPVDVSNIEVEIYAYNTVASARDQKSLIEQDAFGEVVISADFIGTIDRHGYYVVRVAPTGAILYKIGIGKTVLLEEVDGRDSIDVHTKTDNYLQAAVTTAERLEVGAIDPRSEIEGNMMFVNSLYTIPANTAKPNVRLILQPVLLYADTGDTLSYMKPQVIDGEEYSWYHLVNMGFNQKNDILHPYISDGYHLTKESQTFAWSDSVYLEDPAQNYLVMGCFQFEDYKKIYKYTEQPLSSMRPRRPMRFISFSPLPMELDPDDYKEIPRKERFSADERIDITFNVNAATFDLRDSATVASIDGLTRKLDGVIHTDGSQLKEFHISCVASPEGSYDSNVKLADKRMKYAIGQIQSHIPKRVRDRVYWSAESRVAGWGEVADMLVSDGRSGEAAQITAAIQRHPASQDAQSAEIRRMSIYETVIKDYLPRLRTVRYSYVQEINRNPTLEDIMRKYESDPGYLNGDKRFSIYEYWMLFQNVRDTSELYRLYASADKAHRELHSRPWLLASNGMAVLKIKQGIVDTALLKPFVDFTVKHTDVKVKRSYGQDIINPGPVVANQLMMYLQAGNFTQASRLSRMLPETEEYEDLKNFTLCLGGYYKGGRTPEEIEQTKKVFAAVERSSPLNKVVINLAMRMKSHDRIAEQSMPALEASAVTPHDRAMVQYMWAVICQRKFEATNDIMLDMERMDRLIEAFRLDPSLVDVAAFDGDLDKQIYESAKEMYQTK